jgi:hypothetical protein
MTSLTRPVRKDDTLLEPLREQDGEADLRLPTRTPLIEVEDIVNF